MHDSNYRSLYFLSYVHARFISVLIRVPPVKMRIGLVGSAGRDYPSRKLLQKYGFEKLQKIVLSDIKKHTDLETLELVSGGSAWSDHIAVKLYLDGVVNKLTLYFPTEFDTETAMFKRDSPGRTLNALHTSATLRELADAVRKGATVEVYQGFAARNRAIVKDIEVLLALSVGGTHSPTSSGTRMTWNFAREKNVKRCMIVIPSEKKPSE